MLTKPGDLSVPSKDSKLADLMDLTPEQTDKLALELDRPDLASPEAAKEYKRKALDVQKRVDQDRPTWGTSAYEGVTLFGKEMVNGGANMAMAVPELARSTAGWVGLGPQHTFNPAKYDIFDTSNEKTWTGTAGKLLGNFFGAGKVLKLAGYGIKSLGVLKQAAGLLKGSPQAAKAVQNPWRVLTLLTGKKYYKTARTLIEAGLTLEPTAEITLVNPEEQSLMTPQLLDVAVAKLKDSKVKNMLQVMSSNLKYYQNSPIAIRSESVALSVIFGLALSGASRRQFSKMLKKPVSELDNALREADSLTEGIHSAAEAMDTELKGTQQSLDFGEAVDGVVEKVKGTPKVKTPSNKPEKLSPEAWRLISKPPTTADLPFEEGLKTTSERITELLPEEAVGKILGYYKETAGESIKSADDLLKDLAETTQEGLPKRRKNEFFQQMLTDLAVVTDSPIDKLYINLVRIREMLADGGPKAKEFLRTTDFFKNLDGFMQKYGGWVTDLRKRQSGTFGGISETKMGKSIGGPRELNLGPEELKGTRVSTVAEPMAQPSRELTGQKGKILWGKTLEVNNQLSSEATKGSMETTKMELKGEAKDSTEKTFATKADDTLRKMEGPSRQAMGIPDRTLPTASFEDVDEFISESLRHLEETAGGSSPVINGIKELKASEPIKEVTVVDQIIAGEKPTVVHAPEAAKDMLTKVLDLGNGAALNDLEDTLTRALRDSLNDVKVMTEAATKGSPNTASVVDMVTESMLKRVKGLYPSVSLEELTKAVSKLVKETVESSKLVMKEGDKVVEGRVPDIFSLTAPKSIALALGEYLGFRKFSLTYADGLKRIFNLGKGPMSRRGFIDPSVTKFVAKAGFGAVAGSVAQAMATGEVSWEGAMAGATMAVLGDYYFSKASSTFGDVEASLKRIGANHDTAIAKLKKAIEVGTQQKINVEKLKQALKLMEDAKAQVSAKGATISKAFKDSLLKSPDPKVVEAAKAGDISKLAEVLDINPMYFQSDSGINALVNGVKQEILKLTPKVDLVNIRKVLEERGYDLEAFTNKFGDVTTDIAEDVYAINLISDSTFNSAIKLASKVNSGTATKEEALQMVNKFTMLATTAEIMQKGMSKLRASTRGNNFKFFSMLADANALTPENSIAIAEILQKARNTTEAARMAKFSLDHPWIKRVNDLQLIAMFSSPKTWLKNAAGNTFSLMQSVMTQGARTAIGIITGEEGITVSSYMAYLEGLVEGGQKFSTFDSLKALSDSLGYNAFKEVDPSVALKDGSVVSQALDIFKKALVGLGSIKGVGFGLVGFDPMKILGLTDAYFKGILLNARAKQQIAIEYSKAVNKWAAEGVSEGVIKVRGKELIKSLSQLEDPDLVKKLFDHKGNNMALNVILSESRELAEKLNYEFDINGIATDLYDYSSYYTYTRNMRRDHLTGGLIRFINEYPALKLIWPVLNCPVNIAHVTVQHIPLVGAALSKEMRVLFDPSAVGTKAFSEAAAKQAMGATLLFGGIMAANRGIVVGRMPSTRDDSFATLSGKAKNSILIGDQSINLDAFGPIGNLYGLSADLLNTYKLAHRNGDQDMMEKTQLVMMGVSSTLVHYMTDPGFVEGYSQLGEMINTSDDDVSGKAWSAFGREMAIRSIPQVYSDLARTFNNTKGNQLEFDLQFARNYIESVSQRFHKSRTKVGLYGEPLMGNNLMFGFKSNHVQFSQLHDEIEKHQIPMSSFLKNRESYAQMPLSDEQYYDKAKLSGEYLLSHQDRILGRRYFDKPEYEQKRILREFLSAANGYADIQLGKKYPQLRIANKELSKIKNPDEELYKRKRANKLPSLKERLGL